MKTGKHKFTEQLLTDDFSYMFGNPGTSEEGLLDALSAYPELKYITCLHESVAVAIADGYARKSGKPALVQLHSGVGLGNGIGMMYQALRGHSPLVVIAGEAGVKYDSMNAQMDCDLVSMAKPVTKWADRVIDENSVLRLLRRAIKTALAPPMGPVFLALPLDILDRTNNETVTPTTRINFDVPLGQVIAVNIADLLADAKNPAFIIGDGIGFAGAKSETEKLAELLNAKVYGADDSQINFSHTNPLWQGQLGHMFGEDSAAKISGHDVVLVSGTYVFPEVFPLLELPFGEMTKVIHIDLNAYEIAKNFPVCIGAVANPKYAFSQLAEILIGRGFQRKKNATKKVTAIHGQTVADVFFRELSERADKDVIIFDEALTNARFVSSYFPKSENGEWFQTRGGSLGVGIPGAIGIKLSEPEKQVIAFTGDGGSMYTIQALYTAARYNIGAKFVVLNNHSYRLLKDNLVKYRDGEYSEDFPDCFSLGNIVDYAALAKSTGVKSAKVTDAESAKMTAAEMLCDNKPFLVELDIETLK